MYDTTLNLNHMYEQSRLNNERLNYFFIEILGCKFCINNIFFWATNESKTNDREVLGLSAAAATRDSES